MQLFSWGVSDDTNAWKVLDITGGPFSYSDLSQIYEVRSESYLL